MTDTVEKILPRKSRVSRLTGPLLYLLPVIGTVNLLFYESTTVGMLMLLAAFIVSVAVFMISRSYNRMSAVVVLVVNLASLTVTGLLYSSWGSIIQYLNLLLMAFSFSGLRVSKKQFRRMHFLAFVLLSVYLFTLTITDGNLSKVFDIRGNRINPNIVAMLFLSAFIHFVCYVNMTRSSKGVKLLVDSVALVLFTYKILEYESRSVLISLVLFLLLALFFKHGIKYDTYKNLTVGILLSSLLFLFVYILMYERLGDIQILGKSLYTGREIIWGSALDIIERYPIFGCGNLLKFDSIHGTMTYSAHHTIIGLWKILGIVPTLTFMFSFVNRSYRQEGSVTLRLPMLATISMLPICFFESFYTEAALYLFFVPFLMRHVESEE